MSLGSCNKSEIRQSFTPLQREVFDLFYVSRGHVHVLNPDFTLLRVVYDRARYCSAEPVRLHLISKAMSTYVVYYVFVYPIGQNPPISNVVHSVGHGHDRAVSYTHLTLPTIYSV